MIWGRVSGKLLQARAVDQAFILGYVNSNFTPTYSVPCTTTVGSSSVYGAVDCRIYGTDATERNRQIYAKVTRDIAAGTYVYVNFVYYLG